MPSCQLDLRTSFFAFMDPSMSDLPMCQWTDPRSDLLHALVFDIHNLMFFECI